MVEKDGTPTPRRALPGPENCDVCGMMLKPKEFHPDAACILFEATKSRPRVVAMMSTIRAHGARDSARRAITALGHLIQIEEKARSQATGIPQSVWDDAFSDARRVYASLTK